MLKSTFLLCCFGVLSLAVSAQGADHFFARDSVQSAVNNQPDTLRNGFFKARRFHSSFHVQLGGDIAWFLRQPGMFTNYGMRWVINHKITVGVQAHYLTLPSNVGRYLFFTTGYDPNKYKENPIRPKHIVGLLNVGYVFRAFRKFSVHPELGGGYGYLTFKEQNGSEPTLHYGMANLAINYVWNTTKYFRIGAVTGLRVSFGEKYQGMKGHDLYAMYAGVFIRGGTF